MSIGSVSNANCSFKGLGAMQVGDKVKLLTSSKLEKTLFANPALNDINKQNLSSIKAKKYLAVFGKFAKKVQLNPEHIYEYSNAHGTAQLYDITADKNVIQGVKKLSRPITTLVKNIFERIVKK